MNISNHSDELISNLTTDSSNLLLHLSIWSLRIVCPLFAVICPIFNWACIRTFQSRIYARSSSKWYFIFIAIFDTIYVVVTAPLLFLITIEIYILNWNIFFCKSIVFFNYLSCQISAGLLACLSIDRLFATSCISLYRRNCTTNFSRMICFSVIAVFSIVNSHYLIGYTIDSNRFCSIRRYKWYEANYSRLNVVYLLSYSIIPFTIITICNIFIVISVGQNKANMKKKYAVKKSIPSTGIQQEQATTPSDSNPACDKPPTSLKIRTYSMENNSEHRRDTFVSVNEDKGVTTSLVLTNDGSNYRINVPMTLNDQLANSSEFPSNVSDQKRRSVSSCYDRSSSTTIVPPLSSQSTHTQKICVQLQITISLLAISICFILCTLPNFLASDEFLLDHSVVNHTFGEFNFLLCLIEDV
ncbi:unnamed protein product [Adineta ricciae]|uniref:G-protein coupled receptors family 1 profile domain-containing protein n=1 Tax=Adineta ricciae TaxID=249248 RepID=A0A815LKC1_ADIRI|nr:unnamed protein product [Adineta ricciae]CAF1407156.1 unnamed protein product [Adineta ricciae]